MWALIFYVIILLFVDSRIKNDKGTILVSFFFAFPLETKKNMSERQATKEKNNDLISVAAPSIENALMRDHSTMTPSSPYPRLCVIFHLGYMEEWSFYESYLCHLAHVPFDFYVTVRKDVYPDSTSLLAVEKLFSDFHRSLCEKGGLVTSSQKTVNHDSGDAISAGQTFVLSVENRGLDGGGWFMALHAIQKMGRSYQYVLKVHSKSTRHLGPEWRLMLIRAVASSPHKIDRCLRMLDEDPSVGMIGSAQWLFSEGTRTQVKAFADRIGIPITRSGVRFIAGTMFWARFEVLARPFRSMDLQKIITTLPEGFPVAESDGHWIERLFGYFVEEANLRVVGIE